MRQMEEKLLGEYFGLQGGSRFWGLVNLVRMGAFGSTPQLQSTNSADFLPKHLHVPRGTQGSDSFLEVLTRRLFYQPLLGWNPNKITAPQTPTCSMWNTKFSQSYQSVSAHDHCFINHLGKPPEQINSNTPSNHLLEGVFYPARTEELLILCHKWPDVPRGTLSKSTQFLQLGGHLSRTSQKLSLAGPIKRKDLSSFLSLLYVP